MSRIPADDALRRARVYDDVADAYERVNAPRMFDAPARELVALAGIPARARVLDVGAGTGAVSRAVSAAARGARVVALDPSLDMLRAARRGGVTNAVGGALPDLPFSDASFDALVSAFVVSHVDDPDRAIHDMRRVLRPGGTVALSAWGPTTDAYAAAWKSVIHEFVEPDRLESAASRALPGDARFSRPDGLTGLMAVAGLASVQSITRRLVFALTVDEYIAAREVCAAGRALRVLLDDDEWSRYRRRAKTDLARRFPGGVRFDRDVYLARGLRPAV